MMQHRFSLGVEVPALWFDGFRSQSIFPDFVILCVTVGIVCFLRTSLGCLTLINCSYTYASNRIEQRSKCVRIACHCLAALTRILDFALGYLLMLAFMIQNLWICLVIIVVSTLAYFLTYWSRIRLPKYNSRPKNTQEGDGEEMATFLLTPAEGDAPRNVQHSQPNPLSDEQRRSMEVSHLVGPLSTFERHHRYDTIEDERETVNEQATLLVRPDILSGQPAGPIPPFISEGANSAGLSSQSTDEPQTKDRSDSNPLLDKYPVLRFHNIDMPDGPANSDQSTSGGLEIDELDQLIKDLQQS